MPLILLTNDDGIHAPGLEALEEVLSGLGQVWTIAPHIERSACGRSVTLDRPLRVTELAPRRLMVDGTPADCVLLGFRRLLQEPPAVVVSGINRGLNVGEDVDYSGTVGAASEAALQGCRGSLAVSLKKEAYPGLLGQAARLTRVLAASLLANPLPAGCLINVNLPARETDRVRWTRQGDPLPAGFVQVGDDPRGKRFYWIAERPGEDHPPPDTDRGALAQGLISLSLLTLDRNWRGEVVRFSLDGFREDPA